MRPVEEKGSCHTTFQSATEEMGLATCRRYGIVAAERCTKPGAVSAQHAGAFLNAIPINVIGTHMDEKSLHLGAPVCAKHRVYALQWTSTGFTV